MGAVWRGRDVVLGRTVAVKRLGLATGGAEPDLERARREAQLAASLNHPHVVAVFDLVEDQDGWHWLVMEHVDGSTLAGAIRARGALPEHEVADVGAQVGSALAAAHAEGIVHRDVKPSNVLLPHVGPAKLSDFGIARAQSDAALTQTGLVTGSPAYLAPEVATGQRADPSSDIWSLGATLFHAAAGRAPYESDDNNLVGALYRIVHEDPPRLPGSGPLVAMVTAMMDQEPANRPTAHEVTVALAELGVVGDTTAPVADVDQQTRPLAAVAAAPEPVTDTAAFSPLDEPTHATPTIRPTVVAPAPGPVAASATPHRRDEPSRLPVVAVVVGLAAVVLLALLLVPQLLGGDDRAADPAEPTAQQSSSPAAGTDSDQPLTEDDLAEFAEDYVDTAAGDPEEGFALLTPAYQDASGGLEGYRGFWERVSDARISTVQADPDALTVTYAYTYVVDGDGGEDDDGARQVAETVRLQLVRDGDELLIDGAESL